MLTVMLQMALLIAAGTLWQRLAPQHIPALAHRRALTDLVFYILLPALVLDVIWRASIDLTSIKISLVGLSGLLFAAILMQIVLFKMKTTLAQKGAMILAAVFPNVTYLGLPVTNQVLGSWTNSIVLQYDLFACTPMLLTLGVLMAHYYGSNGQPVNPLTQLVKVPPLWAVSIALILNTFGVSQPEIIHSVLQILSGGVVPLMLIVLGMSIRWDSMRLKYLTKLLPIAVISLFLVPIEIYWMGTVMNLSQQVLSAMVILSAMPTMLLGLVICERYQLDSTLYAAAVTFTTVLSAVSLSIWYHWLPVS